MVPPVERGGGAKVLEGPHQRGPVLGRAASLLLLPLRPVGGAAVVLVRAALCAILHGHGGGPFLRRPPLPPPGHEGGVGLAGSGHFGG